MNSPLFYATIAKEEVNALKILLLEDNESIAKGLAYSFEKNNYEFTYRTTVKETEAYLLKNDDLDLIILDIALPDGNGFDLYKNEIKPREIATIFLTARDDEDDIVNQNADPNMQYVEDYTAPDGTAYKLISGFFKSLHNWTYTQPYILDSLFPTPVSEVTLSNRDSIGGGIFWQNVAEYRTVDGEPSSLSRKLYITMTGGGLFGTIPYITLNTPKTMILDGGYLIMYIID